MDPTIPIPLLRISRSSNIVEVVHDSFSVMQYLFEDSFQVLPVTILSDDPSFISSVTKYLFNQSVPSSFSEKGIFAWPTIVKFQGNFILLLFGNLTFDRSPFLRAMCKSVLSVTALAVVSLQQYEDWSTVKTLCEKVRTEYNLEIAKVYKCLEIETSKEGYIEQGSISALQRNLGEILGSAAVNSGFFQTHFYSREPEELRGISGYLSIIRMVIKTVERRNPAILLKYFQTKGSISCLLLMSWKENGNEISDIKLHTDVMLKLRESFKDQKNVISMLAAGQRKSGLNSLLDKLANCEMTNPFSLFGSFQGIAVYPCPVPFRNGCALLMKATNLIFSPDGGMSESKKNVLSMLLNATSTCLVSVEESRQPPFMGDLKFIYNIVQRKEEANHSKLFICVKYSPDLRIPGRVPDAGNDQSLFRFLFRNNDDSAKQCLMAIKTAIFGIVDRKVESEENTATLFQLERWLRRIEEMPRQQPLSQIVPSKLAPSQPEVIQALLQPQPGIEKLSGQSLLQIGSPPISFVLKSPLQPELMQQTVPPIVNQEPVPEQRKPIPSEACMVLGRWGWDMTLVNKTITELKNQFTSCATVIPVLEVADESRGKISVLDDFAALGGGYTPFAEFKRCYGAIVYTKPIPLQNYFLLLIKIPFEDSWQADPMLMRQSLAPLLSISPVCIVNIDSSYLRSSLKTMFDTSIDLNILGWISPKFFIFNELSQSASLLSDFQTVSNMFEICPTDDVNCVQNVKNRIIDPSLHQRYFSMTYASSHDSMILGFVTLLEYAAENINNFLVSVEDLHNQHQSHNSDLVSEPKLASSAVLESMVPGPDQSLCCKLLLKWDELLEGELKAARTKVELDLAVLEQLRNNFKNIDKLLPVMAIGKPQSGKSTVLDKLAESVVGNDPFKRAQEYSGVLVLPVPIPMGSYNLLLMEVSGFAGESNNVPEFVKKILFMMFSIASTGMLFFEEDSFLQAETIVEIRRKAESQCKLCMSKLFVVSSNANKLEVYAKRKKIGAIEQWLKERQLVPLYSDSLSFVSDFTSVLLPADIHRKFITSHREFARFASLNSEIEVLFSILNHQIKLIGHDWTLFKFYEIMPNFTAHDILLQLQAVNAQIQKLASIESGQTLNLIEFDRNGIEANLNSATLTILLEHFNQTKLIAPIVTLGGQGMGKSTLLNSIINLFLQRTTAKKCFSEGNTVNHITRGAKVFTSPLRIPVDQLCRNKMGEECELMLIDLEGLGGMEIIDPMLKIKQHNLMSSVLTIASVFLVLVRNEIDSLNFINEKIEYIRRLRDIYRFEVDRILLLFHDKSPGLEINITLEENTIRMNANYFKSRPVVQILCKPNFTEDSHIRDEFLRILISKIGFPKRTIDGQSISIHELASCMLYIATSTTKDPEIPSDPLDLMIVKIEVEKVTKELNKIFEKCTCDNYGQSLVSQYDRNISVVMIETRNKLTEKPVVMKYVEAKLKLAISHNRWKLKRIEHWFDLVQDHGQIASINSITATAINKYRDGLSMEALDKLGKSYCGILSDLKARYQISEFGLLIDQIIAGIQSNLAGIQTHVWGSRVVKFISIVISAINPIVLLVAIGVSIADAVITIQFQESALQVYIEERYYLVFKQIVFNDKVEKIANSLGINPIPVLVLIGDYSTNPSFFLSQFWLSAFFFPDESRKIFKKNHKRLVCKQVQYIIMPLKSSTNGVIIQILIDSNSDSARSINLAAALMQVATLSIVIEGRDTSFLKQIRKVSILENVAKYREAWVISEPSASVPVEEMRILKEMNITAFPKKANIQQRNEVTDQLFNDLKRALMNDRCPMMAPEDVLKKMKAMI